MLGYGGDYSKNALQYAFAKDSTDTATSSGCPLRRDVTRTGFGNHAFNITLKIPLTYVSTFFRRLNFPIINNEMDLKVTLRFVDCILRGNNVQASRLTVTNTELYLPIIELPKEFEKKLYGMLSSSSSTKEILWDHMNVYEIPQMVTGRFDREIVPSLNGVKKMYVMAIPAASWKSQEHSETTCQS